jgi:hypothetical protein
MACREDTSVSEKQEKLLKINYEKRFLFYLLSLLYVEAHKNDYQFFHFPFQICTIVKQSMAINKC